MLAALIFGVLFVVSCYRFLLKRRKDPLQELCGPPVTGGPFGSHMKAVLDPFYSPKTHERYVALYGRNVRVRGMGPWDDRLLTMDPVSLAHVLKNSAIYEKPWQSRRLITSLIGCGMLAAEGMVYQRQRRVATPAFSMKNMRDLIPLVWNKGMNLKAKWNEIISQEAPKDNAEKQKVGARLDICHWISRATFDVMGVAGFDYEFNAIQDETNPLFSAYKDMFEVAISQGENLMDDIRIYLPILNRILPNFKTRTVAACQSTISNVAGRLIQVKKAQIVEAERTGKVYQGKDVLSLLLKSNSAIDLPPEQRISDDDILHNINTLMFAGSDTTSLALTWTLLLLAKQPALQTRLRDELLTVAPAAESDLTPNEIQSLYATIATLPFLDNVIRESLRVVPPVHSSLRVATQDDVIPTSYPIHVRQSDGSTREEHRSFRINAGTFVHVPIEAFHLDKKIWGPDAWKFNPDRWDQLPEAVLEISSSYNNLLTFSAGPRTCIGQRFSIIEMKTFLYLLITNFEFAETTEKIFKANVVLTRPYILGKFKAGSQCPMFVSRFVR